MIIDKKTTKVGDFPISQTTISLLLFLILDSNLYKVIVFLAISSNLMRVFSWSITLHPLCFGLSNTEEFTFLDQHINEPQTKCDDIKSLI